MAARDGIVIAIKEDSNKGCKSRKCQSLANYLLIYHDDGTFGSYVHLKKNGAKVKEGDKVKAGDIVGLSGNTGWSSGPHLHFEVYIPEMNKRHSVKTKFKVGEDEVETCPESVDVIIKDYNCMAGENGFLNISLKNKGRFSVDGYVHAGMFRVRTCQNYKTT